MKEILVNSLQCKKCGDILISTHVHDFKFCSCGAVAVDGGKEYLRRVGNKEDFDDLSIIIDTEGREICWQDI